VETAHALGSPGAHLIGTVVVATRYEGPPGAANGGWIAGTLAGHLPGAAHAGAGWAAEVVLRARTPLETPLSVEAGADGGVRLADGGTVLVEAHPAEPADASMAPPFVALDTARAAASAAQAAVVHPFAGCFGCGTGRDPGDGLRLLPGQVPASPPGLVAAPWTVDASLAGPDGTVGRHLLWSALDCPQFWAHRATLGAREELVALLARQTVTLAAPPASLLAGTVLAGETYVVVARASGAEGRKLRSSSALYTADVSLVATATSLWIRLEGLHP
jgi:hypothetical protein